MEVEELHTTVSILSNEVQRLRDERDLIIDEIKRYEGTLSKYKEQQILLDEMMNHIEGKRILINSLELEIDILVGNKSRLLKESEGLQELIDKKTTLITEIEKLTKDSNIIQEDIRLFHNQFSDKKTKSEAELDTIYEKIEVLHSHIGEIVLKK